VVKQIKACACDHCHCLDGRHLWLSDAAPRPPERYGKPEPL